MDSKTLALRVALVVLAGAFAGWVALYTRRHPNRAKKQPDALRMPKLVAVIGWLIFIVGLIMCLAAFATDGGTDPTAMRIASVAVTVGGAFFLFIYHNFRLWIRYDEIAFRTIFGRSRVIRYDQIDKYKFASTSAGPTISVKGVDGAKISFNLNMFDATPLLNAIQFYEQQGHWPYFRGY